MSSENYYIEQVEHFNNVFGKLNNEKPTLVNEKEAQFIYDFIKEELDEYMQAYKNGDIVECEVEKIGKIINKVVDYSYQ